MDQNQVEQKPSFDCLCGQIPQLSKEVGLVEIPFWMRWRFWDLWGFWATRGLEKTTGLFPAGIYVHRSWPQRAKFSSPSFNTFLHHPISHHHQRCSHLGNQAEREDDSFGVMHEISDKPEQTSRVLVLPLQRGTAPCTPQVAWF